MDIHTKKINDDEIENLNVRCVIEVLAYLRADASEDELVKCFETSSDEPQNLVQKEMKRILDHGVATGLIVRNANKYGLPNWKHEYQIDGDDSDVEYIDPNISRYEVYSSPEAHATGMGYRRVRHKSLTPPPKSPTPTRRAPKRKYSKRGPEPTTRVTRSASRGSRAKSPEMIPASSRVKKRTKGPAMSRAKSPAMGPPGAKKSKTRSASRGSRAKSPEMIPASSRVKRRAKSPAMSRTNISPKIPAKSRTKSPAMSRAKSPAMGPPGAKKSKNEPREATRFSTRTVARSGRKGAGRGR